MGASRSASGQAGIAPNTGFAAREADIIAIDPRSLPGGGGDHADITCR